MDMMDCTELIISLFDFTSFDPTYRADPDPPKRAIKICNLFYFHQSPLRLLFYFRCELIEKNLFYMMDILHIPHKSHYLAFCCALRL